MFSIFPTKKNSWEPAYTALVMPMLPFVGLVIGLAWYTTALSTAELPIMLHSAAIALTPTILTGALHIDGFMDTADAVLSRRPLEEKRRILKDSTVGAFAVVSAICMFLLQLCAAYSIAEGGKTFHFLIFIPVVSRSVAGVAVMGLKPISQSGYMHTFKEGTKLWHIMTIVITSAMSLAVAFATGGVTSLTVLCVVLSGTAFMSLYLYKQLQGFSGDLCGSAIASGELFGLITLAVI